MIARNKNVMSSVLPRLFVLGYLFAGCSSDSGSPGSTDGGAGDGPAPASDTTSQGGTDGPGGADGQGSADGQSPADGRGPADLMVGDGPVGRAALVARTCALSASCQIALWGGDDITPSNCADAFSKVDWPIANAAFGPDRKLAEHLLGCASHTSCSDFFACAGGTWITLDRCLRKASCTGTSVVSDVNPQARYDCSTIGATCQSPSSTVLKRACCVVGSCTSSSTTSCSGSNGQLCVSKMLYNFDCAPSGRVCTETGTALCAGIGAACGDLTATTCAGTTASYCSMDKLASVDCATNALSSACVPGAVAFPCGPEGTECDASFMGQCQGNSMVLCVNGHKQAVDCIELGFASCKAAPNAPAVCVPPV